MQISADTFEINPKIFDALPHEPNINVKYEGLKLLSHEILGAEGEEEFKHVLNKVWLSDLVNQAMLSSIAKVHKILQDIFNSFIKLEFDAINKMMIEIVIKILSEHVKKQKKNKLVDILFTYIEDITKSDFFIRTKDITLLKIVLKLCKKLIEMSN